MTHHLPSWKSVHPRYATSVLNRFFLSDEEETILECQPKLWIHGHTHKSFDYMIGDTRVVCNPFGYPFEQNMQFDPSLVIELP